MKRAIEKGNIEGARIYAQNAIRKKTEQLNYLKVRLARRLCGEREAALRVPFGVPSASWARDWTRW